jgi:hypothetical protein
MTLDKKHNPEMIALGQSFNDFIDNVILLRWEEIKPLFPKGHGFRQPIRTLWRTKLGIPHIKYPFLSWRTVEKLPGPDGKSVTLASNGPPVEEEEEEGGGVGDVGLPQNGGGDEKKQGGGGDEKGENKHDGNGGGEGDGGLQEPSLDELRNGGLSADQLKGRDVKTYYTVNADLPKPEDVSDDLSTSAFGFINSVYSGSQYESLCLPWAPNKNGKMAPQKGQEHLVDDLVFVFRGASIDKAASKGNVLKHSVSAVKVFNLRLAPSPKPSAKKVDTSDYKPLESAGKMQANYEAAADNVEGNAT